MKENEKKVIPPQKAKKMVELYRDCCGKHPGGKLTKSVWFDLAKLKTLISEIDDETTSADGPGLRFYFGTYLEEEDVKIRYRNTLIMVSTKYARDANGNLIKDDDGNYINEDYGVEKIHDPVNQGELCPESCAGTDRWGQGG